MARQERVFLDEILANPADDAPRLAYADWLKENGQPARADLIRVQCELARREEDAPGQQKRRQREKALLKKHAAEWNANLPEWVRVGGRFRRGFVAAVVTDLETFLKHGGAVVKVTPLEGLEMNSSIGDKGAKALAKCPHAAGLTELRLGWSGITAQGAKALAGSPYLTRLRVLDLINNHLGDEGLKALAAAPQLAGLTYLDLCTNDVGLAGLKAVQAAGWRLTTLRLANNELGTKATAFLAGMSCLAALTLLELSDCGIDAEAMKALAASPHLSNLRFLGLAGNPIQGAGAVALAGAPTFANLTQLEVYSCDLDDEAALALARSPHLSGLKSLSVHSNPRISEAAGRELTRRFGKAAYGVGLG